MFRFRRSRFHDVNQEVVVTVVMPDGHVVSVTHEVPPCLPIEHARQVASRTLQVLADQLSTQTVAPVA